MISSMVLRSFLTRSSLEVGIDVCVWSGCTALASWGQMNGKGHSCLCDAVAQPLRRVGGAALPSTGASQLMDGYESCQRAGGHSDCRRHLLQGSVLGCREQGMYLPAPRQWTFGSAFGACLGAVT